MFQSLVQKLLSNKFVRGSAIFSAASFVVSFINYLFNLVVARGFSLADYGEYLSAISYVTMFSIPFGALTVILIKKIGSQDPAHRRRYAMRLERWLIGQVKQHWLGIGIVFSLLFTLLYWKANLQLNSILFVLLLSLVTFMQVFYFAVLLGFKAFLIHGALLAGVAIFKLVGGGGVTFLFPELSILYGLFLLANVIGVVVGHFLIAGKQKDKLDNSQFSHVFSYLKKKSTLIPLFTTLGIVGISNVDLMLVKKFMLAEQAGLYGALSLLAKVILYFVTPITAVAYTFFTGKESKHQSVPIIGLVVLLFLLVGVASVSFYAFVPELIVTRFFGEKFLSISPLLWLGAIYGSLYSLVTFFSHYYMARLSKIGLFSLLALLMQMILIYLFHSSLKTVIVINVVVVSFLLIPYIGLLFVKIAHQNEHSNPKK